MHPGPRRARRAEPAGVSRPRALCHHGPVRDGERAARPHDARDSCSSASPRGPMSLPGSVPDRLTGGVFVGDEVRLDVSFAAARAGLATVTRDGLLLGVSEDAYGEWITGLVRVG